MKVGVIGCGHVGSTAAFAMALRGTASEIVLVDVNPDFARAQAEDIRHATSFGPPVRVRAGDVDALENAAVIILACGVGQRPGESRLQLLGRNVAVFQQVIPAVVRRASQPILLVATNPVDVMTLAAARISGLPPERVIGTGTLLDTARFRALLGDHLGVAPLSIHAYVLGEHGDSEVFVWSSAQAGGISLDDFAAQRRTPLTPDDRRRIDDAVRGAAHRIISGKGATYFGIGGGIARIVQAVRDDERRVLTVTSVGTGPGAFAGISVSLPRLIGSAGILQELQPSLSAGEQAELIASADVIRDAAAGLDLG